MKTAEGVRFGKRHLAHVGVGHGEVKGVLALLDNVVHVSVQLAIKVQMLALKEADRLTLALKGDDEHVGCVLSVGGVRVRLAGLVKEDLTLRENDPFFVPRADEGTLDGVDHLPEIVRFLVPRKVRIKLKVMHRYDLGNIQKIFDLMLVI